MTTDNPVPPGPSGREASGPSIHVLRARKLLYGGLAGGVTAGLIGIIILTITGGTRGLASGALGVAMVLFFYAVGQLVMVRFADAGARTLLAVSMTSYTARVVVLGVILLIFSKNRQAWSAIDANAIFIATIAVVVGWLVVEVYVFRRLRISIYDAGYTDRTGDDTGNQPTDPSNATDPSNGSPGTPAEKSDGDAAVAPPSTGPEMAP